jgi:hypothetical protein
MASLPWTTNTRPRSDVPDARFAMVKEASAAPDETIASRPER